MEVLVCGLNSYLGRASVSCLQEDGYNVHGLVRDVRLLSQHTFPATADIVAVDLIKKGAAYTHFSLTQLDLSFYFTQIPDLDDKIAVQYELLSLRHFILLSQRNGCNRVIYVGRTYDKNCLTEIKALFLELGVAYTIVLKDIALGVGTSFDRFMTRILAHKYVFLFNPTGKIRFSPFVLKDIFRWIKKVPWHENFIREEIEFGGAEVLDLKDLLREHVRKQGLREMCKIISLQNKRLTQLLNRSMYGIRRDTYSEYILNVTRGSFADNSKWQSLFSFDFTPIYS
ncbi:SDR family oxidoreductase [Sphingobacterium sp. SGG-5]|uniref:SDR family oxidoreductase n=1 Tax=Sphingobacterium sp. SGG-5 TaxID=2710881 RepID=UPI0013EE2893|nr:SDR family oxidoreductase [Sphingobacterium sp. SGG-5]NGM61202.1 SDR family oxidoreductase [Sphingobacterium sp. SGG-5]